MKKYLNYYLVVWAIAIIIFNIIVWVIPNELYGFQKTVGAFWPGYIFINLAIIAMLPCGYYVAKSENKERLFLNMPIMSLSFTALVVMTIVGIICMAVPGIPAWAGIIVCLIIFGFEVVAITSTKAAGEMINDIDNKVKDQTFFIRSLTADAKCLMDSAESVVAKSESQKVFEAIRYSDPVSSLAVGNIEAQITTKFSEFADAVRNCKESEMQSLSKELQILINDRNIKCKLNK